MNWKSISGITLLLIVAFAWGYAGPDVALAVTRRLHSWRAGESTPVAAAPSPGPAKQTVSGGPVPVPPAPPPKGPVAQAVQQPVPVPGQHKESLAQTLNTIQPGQVPADQISKRNEYFERLSQSMKASQNNPPAPAAPNPPPGSPPNPQPMNDQPPPPPAGPYASMPGGPGHPVPAPPPPGTVGGGIGQEINAPEEEPDTPDSSDRDDDHDDADDS